MEPLHVIKIGGQVLDDATLRREFLHDFAAIPDKKLLIHGGGKIATRIGEKLGITSHYVKGRRITDEATRDLVTMVYGGLMNKAIVADLQALGCDALGLTGADGNLLHAVRRPVREVDFGYVGDVTPDGVNRDLLFSLLQRGTVPVLSPLTHDRGEMLNTNADTIASVVAIALSSMFHVRLVFCFDKKGVLRHPGDDTSVIPRLDRELFEKLNASQAFADGILPKLENAFATVQGGVQEVIIGDAACVRQNTGKEVAGTWIAQ